MKEKGQKNLLREIKKGFPEKKKGSWKGSGFFQKKPQGGGETNPKNILGTQEGEHFFLYF